MDKYRLNYHLEPKTGWVNDPNGLSYVDGTYYLYYQYAYEAEGGLKYWKLTTTKDLIHYKDQGIVLSPDSKFDKDGAYSGCCFVENNKRYYFYTGNVKHPGNYDYINEGRGHNTLLLESNDGINLTNKKPLLLNKDYPSNMSCHVRDPFIYKKDNTYYMVLGARTKESQGCFLLYQSENLDNWNYVKTIYAPFEFGYMFECPNYLAFNDAYYLFACPQGVEESNYDYEAIYQNGYFVLDQPLENKDSQITKFEEFDYGFDFYAPQFFKANNKTLMLGWMGLPDVDYDNPTIKDGYQHAFTLLREITSKNNHLYSYPVKDYEALRTKAFIINQNICKFDNLSFELHLTFNQDFKFTFRNTVFSYENGLFTLDMTNSGAGRKCKHVKIDKIDTLSIFSDTSSLEIFFNKGEKSLTTRIYDIEDYTLSSNEDLVGNGYYLSSIQIESQN